MKNAKFPIEELFLRFYHKRDDFAKCFYLSLFGFWKYFRKIKNPC